MRSLQRYTVVAPKEGGTCPRGQMSGGRMFSMAVFRVLMTNKA